LMLIVERGVAIEWKKVPNVDQCPECLPSRTRDRLKHIVLKSESVAVAVRKIGQDNG